MQNILFAHLHLELEPRKTVKEQRFKNMRLVLYGAGSPIVLDRYVPNLRCVWWRPALFVVW